MSGQFVGAFDLSGFLAVPNSLKIMYQQNWNIYNRVQTYNANISTLRAAGDLTQDYYTYVTYEELNGFTIGQFLHLQRYPNSNWDSIPKN